MTGPAGGAHPGRDLALAAAGAFCFGLTIVFNRAVARSGLGSSTALAVRFAVAGVLLLGALASLRRPLLPPPGERAAALLLGLVLYSVEATFFFMGLERGTAAAVALLFYAYPAVVTAAEAAAGRLRLRPVTLLALALAVGGGATVAAGGGRVSITAGGVLFTCGSILAFSTYVLAGDRLLVRTDPLTAAAWTAIGAAAGTGLAGAAGGALRAPGGGDLASLVANGAATAAAFTLFFVVLGRMGPSRTAIVMALEAVSGVVLSAVFLDEPVRLAVAAGGAAVLAGAVLAAAAAPRSVETRESASPP